MTHHKLTTETYLYSFVDINTYDADRPNPPLKLAITAPGKNICMFNSDGPIDVKPDDTLVVHGKEINDSDHRKNLAKLFYFTGKTLVYKSGWTNGSGYFFFGVNCDGNSILCVPQARESPTVITKFDLPFIFDWSKYGVKVPGSPLAKKQSEVDQLNEDLQQKDKKIKELEQQLARRDQPTDANGDKIRELEDRQSKLNQELEERNKKLEEKEKKIKELEEKICALMQQEIEKNKNLGELKQKLLTLKEQIEKNDEEMIAKEITNKLLREKQSELEQKLQERDQLMEKKTKEFEENELKLKQELDTKNNQLKENESKIKLLGEQQEQIQRQKNEIASLNQEISVLIENIEKNATEIMEKEGKINELRAKLLERENQLEIQPIVDPKKERQIEKKTQEEIEKLKEQKATLEHELQVKEEKVSKSDVQLITNKLDQLLATLQTGHPQTLVQSLPIPEVVKSRRRSFVPCKFSISSDNLPQFTKQPLFHVSIKNLRVFTPADENVDEKFPKEEICLYTSDHRFHNNEWWFIKVAEYGKMTMLAFYEGDMDEVSVYGKYVRVPFRPETSFRSSTQFFVGLIRGIGLRFMFLYDLI